MKFDSFLKILQAKEKSKETKFSKALEKIQKPPDLSPDETTFSNMLLKVTPVEGGKVEWLEDEYLPSQSLEMHKALTEHKQQLEKALFYSKGLANSSANAWWHGTNDPKGWGGHTHNPAYSASACSSSNYVQIYPTNASVAFKPKMTREKAIAANDGTWPS